MPVCVGIFLITSAIIVLTVWLVMTAFENNWHARLLLGLDYTYIQPSSEHAVILYTFNGKGHFFFRAISTCIR